MQVLVGGVYRLGDAVMALPALRALARPGGAHRAGPGHLCRGLPAGGSCPRGARPAPQGRPAPGLSAVPAPCDRPLFFVFRRFVWALGAALAGIPFRAGLASDGRSFLLTHPCTLIPRRCTRRRAISGSRLRAVIRRAVNRHCPGSNCLRRTAQLPRSSCRAGGSFPAWRSVPGRAIPPSAGRRSASSPGQAARGAVRLSGVGQRCRNGAGGRDRGGHGRDCGGGSAAGDGVRTAGRGGLVCRQQFRVGPRGGRARGAGVDALRPLQSAQVGTAGRAAGSAGRTGGDRGERGRAAHPALAAVSVDDAFAALQPLV
jgi:hypothetical protein